MDPVLGVSDKNSYNEKELNDLECIHTIYVHFPRIKVVHYREESHLRHSIIVELLQTFYYCRTTSMWIFQIKTQSIMFIKQKVDVIKDIIYNENIKYIIKTITLHM